MKAMNKIIHDDRTYIESIGKHDKETVREALADNGADTILRVCIGVNGEEMPTRALGYYASAIAVQEHYFPESELQFVYPVMAASAINGVDVDDSTLSAVFLDVAAYNSFPRRIRKDSPDAANIRSFLDEQLPDEGLENSVAEVLKGESKIFERLRASAKTRGAGCAKYVAAHVLMHDTNPPLTPLGGDGASKFKRVISIGAQSERPFYLARMACQKAKLIPEMTQVETGQLFTKHVIAPYMQCREGEPTLGEDSTNHPVPSVQRDLLFLDTAVKTEEAIFTEMTIPAKRSEYCAGIVTVREFK